MRKALAAALLAFGAVTIVIACKKSEAEKTERICTPGAYVFCRCQSRAEGTKLCTEDGDAFEKCNCGDDGTTLPPLSPNGDPGFEPVDSGPPPTNPDDAIDAKCIGKLAVLASSEEDLFLFAAAYTGKGSWTVAKSQGPALRSAPRGGLVNNALIAVWRTRYNLIAWTKFQANQTSLSPPVSVGNASTPDRAELLSLGTSGKLYYVGTDDKLKEGTYSPSSGWDDATGAVQGTGANIPGKSAPGGVFVGSKTVLAFTGTDGTLSTQSKSGSTWGAATPIPGAKAYEETPAINQLVGGAEDAIIVFVGSDLILHSTTRTAATGAWSAPIVVDTGATANGAPGVAPISKGRAVATWKATNDAPFYSVYDPTKTPVWSTPAELFASKNVAVINPPSVGAGRCAGEATVTYVDKDGNVSIGFFVTGAPGDWVGPFQVPGMTKMTFAGAGEVP